MTFAQSRRTTD